MAYLITAIIYLSFLLGYYWFNKKEQEIYTTKQKWWSNGFSLFAVQFSITTPLLYSGVIHSQGISGLWLYWSIFFISGFAPFVFAPLWSKLNFVTDNQFILFRFTGKSAKYLHLFRTIYVGWIIVAFLISFQLLTFLKVLIFFTGLGNYHCFIILALLLLGSVFLNKIGVNIKMDFINVCFILVLFLAVLNSLYYTNDQILNNSNPLFSNVFPNNTTHLIIYLIVQNFSVSLFDGSGIEAQRFFSTENRKDNWKVASLSVLLQLVFTIIIVFIIYFGVNQTKFSSEIDNEVKILYYFKNSLSSWASPLILLSFFTVFVTSFNGLLNWGSSFLTIDLYKTYFNKTLEAKQESKVAKLAMFFICCTSLLFTFYSSSLESLIKVFFSISAGVAPVFVLRWFWFRINAWTQISAMLSSGVYTLIYQVYFKGNAVEAEVIKFFNLNTFIVQLLFVTFFTIITWVLVALLTPKDSIHVINNFKANVFKDYNTKINILKALLFGALIVLLLWVILAISF